MSRYSDYKLSYIKDYQLCNINNGNQVICWRWWRRWKKGMHQASRDK